MLSMYNVGQWEGPPQVTSVEIDTSAVVQSAREKNYTQRLPRSHWNILFKTTIIIRLGVFHTICTLLAIVGKRFQDAGLRNLCIESDVIADSYISGVMGGRKYNRAVRLHKLVYEALTRLAWKGFLSWLQAIHTDDVVHMSSKTGHVPASCICLKSTLNSCELEMGASQPSGCPIWTWSRFC